MPINGIAGSYGSSISSFLGNIFIFEYLHMYLYFFLIFVIIYTLAGVHKSVTFKKNAIN